MARPCTHIASSPSGGQHRILVDVSTPRAAPRAPFLKWIGSKHRFAPEIVSHFPGGFARYLEPFLGSGAVLGTIAPERGIGSDCSAPLMEIWRALKGEPELLNA